jgi:hypothetical protein
MKLGKSARSCAGFKEDVAGRLRQFDLDLDDDDEEEPFQ